MNNIATNARLTELADEIIATYQKGTEVAIDLGNLFLEARSLHPSNNEFGQWCSDIMSGRMNQKAIHRAMTLAESFTGKDTGRIPLTGLYELAAPKNEAVRDDVVAMLLPHESVTVADVKECIANAQGEPAIHEVNLESDPEPPLHDSTASKDKPPLNDIDILARVFEQNGLLRNYLSMHDLGCLLLSIRQDGTDVPGKDDKYVHKTFKSDDTVIKHVRSSLKRLDRTLKGMPEMAGADTGSGFTDEFARDALSVTRNDERGNEIREKLLRDIA